MQHNALHGSENKHFAKDLEHLQTTSKPLPPTHPFAQANSAVTDIETPALSTSTKLRRP